MIKAGSLSQLLELEQMKQSNSICCWHKNSDCFTTTLLKEQEMKKKKEKKKEYLKTTNKGRKFNSLINVTQVF